MKSVFCLCFSFRGIFKDSSSFQKQTTKKDHTHTHTHTPKPSVNYIICSAFSVQNQQFVHQGRQSTSTVPHTHIQCNRSVTDPYKSTTHNCNVCTGFTSCGPRETIYPQCVPHIQCTETVTEPYKRTTINPFTAMAGCRDVTWKLPVWNLKHLVFSTFFFLLN